MADDLGWAEVGAYGQDKIKTPNIDRLAREGVRFTDGYSGSCVCAPSRCVLLTARDTGHSYIRGNSEMGGWERDSREGQLPMDPSTPTMSQAFADADYRVGGVGKWGLGGPVDEASLPSKFGFNLFHGYLCQRIAHNYYPEHLWRVLDDGAHKEVLAGNTWKNLTGPHFAPDLMIDTALAFVRETVQNDKRLFFYYASPVPHAALQVPDDSLEEYADAFEETPYDGKKGYLKHPKPRAAYAAMVTRMDRNLGRLLDLLDELKIADNTIVLFTSDNRPTFNGGTDSKFFESNGPFRGLKCSLYEGGVRVPWIVRWPKAASAGRVTNHVVSFPDIWPTLAELASTKAPAETEGESFARALLAKGDETVPPRATPVYWEYHPGGGLRAARIGNYKAVQRQMNKAEPKPVELYDLVADPAESKDLSAELPDVMKSMHEVFEARTKSSFPQWNFGPKPKRKKPAKKKPAKKAVSQPQEGGK